MSDRVLASCTGTITVNQKGEKGAVERARNWEEITDGSALECGANGESYIDIVLYNESWYQCITSHPKDVSILPTDTTYFKNITDYKRLATNLFLANKAYIHNLGVDNILITSEGGGEGDVYLKADKEGIVCNKGTFNNVTVSGSIRVPFTKAQSNLDVDYSDNVAILTYTRGDNTYSLTWDNTQNGRRITIANYLWQSQLAYGSGTIEAPSGYYFFEDGEKKSKLVFSRQIVELLGIGDNDTFFGWAVINKVDLATTWGYGHPSRTLCFGKFDATTSSGTFSTVTQTLSCVTYDGSSVTVTRESAGRYKFVFPSDWGNAQNFVPNITLYRYIGSVCVVDRGDDYLTILCSGYKSTDNTDVEGAFLFSIQTAADFDYLN